LTEQSKTTPPSLDYRSVTLVEISHLICFASGLRYGCLLNPRLHTHFLCTSYKQGAWKGQWSIKPTISRSSRHCFLFPGTSEQGRERERANSPIGPAEKTRLKMRMIFRLGRVVRAITKQHCLGVCLLLVAIVTKETAKNMPWCLA
jgi:hypothetical protein